MKKSDKDRSELAEYSDATEEQVTSDIPGVKKKKNMAQQEIDELITVVLPIVNSN